MLPPLEESCMHLMIASLPCVTAPRSHEQRCTDEVSVSVQARVKNKTGSLVSKEYSLDRLGAKQVMRLPTAKSPSGSSDNLAQGSVPAELQEKVASLLASESSRKVGALPGAGTAPCRQPASASAAPGPPAQRFERAAMLW